jgi:hypothetical protein
MEFDEEATKESHKMKYASYIFWPYLLYRIVIHTLKFYKNRMFTEIEASFKK